MQESSTERAAGKIFLCYRREDSAGHAGRIYDRLNRRFPGRVFMDVAGIGVGTRWAEVIEQTLRSCEVAVILIGRRWLERDPAGARRIDDPKDPLRAEITMALRLKLRIIPLLVGGAAVPSQEELPRDLIPLIDWQALTIDDDDFDHDSTRLVEALHLEDEGPDPHLESAGAKSSEVGRLLASAESYIARGDWVRAAQALKAVLSLDQMHEEARARLGFVRQQSTQAYSQVLPLQPPPDRRVGRWKATAGLGAAAAVVAVTLMASMMTTPREPIIVTPIHDETPEPHGEVTPKPHDDEVTPKPQDDEVTPKPKDDETPSTRRAPAAPQMAGEYELISYAYQGVAMPLNGSMHLVPVSDGHFRFESLAKHDSLGEFRYRGRLEKQGGTYWTQTIEESNDPTAVKVPIPEEISFDGSRLVMKNIYAQAVWQKQPSR